MGIADRDYIRSTPPPRRFGVSSPRRWSVTTWLIVICVAVFSFDVVVQKVFPGRFLIWVEDQTVFRDDLPPGAIESINVRDIEWDRDPAAPAVEHGRLPNGLVVARRYSLARPPLTALLHYSTNKLFGLEMWRLIGFQFLHADQYHLIFNMVGLFFFGPLVEEYLGGKRYLAFYLLCGMFGALLYSVLNVAGFVSGLWGVSVPGLLMNRATVPLIGASAGVYGVILAGAYRAPEERVLLFYVIPMKLRTLAYGLVGLAFFTLFTGGANAGGQASHIGGAIAGWYFIRHPRHLHDFFDVLGRVDPTSHHYSGKRRGRRRGGAAAATEAEVDRILEKMKETKGGLGALTKHEREVLRRARG